MKATDFAYWLQGFFEISEYDPNLSKKQALQILEKAQSVKAGTDPVETKVQNFVSYTQGVLTSLTYAPKEENNLEFLKKVTVDLKERLNNIFIHAIDPAVPGDQQQLRKTHRPDNGGGRLEAMC